MQISRQLLKSLAEALTGEVTRLEAQDEHVRKILGDPLHIDKDVYDGLSPAMQRLLGKQAGPSRPGDPATEAERLACECSFEHASNTYFKISDAYRAIVPFRKTAAQEAILEAWADEKIAGRLPRICVLQDRQQGTSTLAMLMMVWRAAFRQNEHFLAVSIDKGRAIGIFEIALRCFDLLPEWLRPKSIYRGEHVITFAHETFSSSIRSIPYYSVESSLSKTKPLTGFYLSHAEYGLDFDKVLSIVDGLLIESGQGFGIVSVGPEMDLLSHTALTDKRWRHVDIRSLRQETNRP